MIRHHCQRCEEKDAELTYLRSELGLVDDLDRALCLRQASGMTMLMARIVLRLHNSRHHLATRLQLADLMDADTELHAIDVHMSRIRGILGHPAIETVPGQGYRLTSAGVSMVNQFLAQAEEAA